MGKITKLHLMSKRKMGTKSSSKRQLGLKKGEWRKVAMVIEEWSLEEQGTTEPLEIEGGHIVLKIVLHLANDSLLKTPTRTP